MKFFWVTNLAARLDIAFTSWKSIRSYDAENQTNLKEFNASPSVTVSSLFRIIIWDAELRSIWWKLETNLFFFFFFFFSWVVLSFFIRVYISLSTPCYRYAQRMFTVTVENRRAFTRKYEWATTAPQYEHKRNYKLQNQKKKWRNQGKFQNQTTNRHIIMYTTGTIIPRRLGFQHLPRDLANVNALKNHVRSLLLYKNWEHLLHFALFLALFCFAFSPMSRERNFNWLCSF